MPPTRPEASSPHTPARRGRSAAMPSSTLLQTADRLVSQIQDLVTEIAGLRAENEALRDELRNAVAMLERASAALGGAANGRRRGGAAHLLVPATRRAARAPRVPRRGRATPAEVTPDVVRAAIGKLGTATSAEIAKEISRAGVNVNGRAIRWIAERAGVGIEETDGQRRYHL